MSIFYRLGERSIVFGVSGHGRKALSLREVRMRWLSPKNLGFLGVILYCMSALSGGKRRFSFRTFDDPGLLVIGGDLQSF